MAGRRGGTRIGAKRNSGDHSKRPARGISIAAMLMLAIFAASLALPFPPSPRFVPAPVPEPVAWEPTRAGDTLTKGAALSSVLASRGFDTDHIREIIRLLQAYRSPRTLRPGTALRFALGATGIPDRILLALTPDSLLHFVHDDSVWTTRIEPVPFVLEQGCERGCGRPRR